MRRDEKLGTILPKFKKKEERETYKFWNFGKNIAGFFFSFENNYKSQTILLVSNVSKLFRKLATQVF